MTNLHIISLPNSKQKDVVIHLSTEKYYSFARCPQGQELSGGYQATVVFLRFIVSVKSFNLETGGSVLAGRLYRPVAEKYHLIPRLSFATASPRTSQLRRPRLLSPREQISRLVFLVVHSNFRGCGERGGNFDILGWTEDLIAVIDYLWDLPEVDRSRFALLGFSGGRRLRFTLPPGIKEWWR